jgi:glycosyltransferase involved in cell wall biosynthesis
MANTLFSIVIPTYNRSNFIRKTIMSVLNQSYPYFEIIVVDDGSTDNTAEVVTSIIDNRVRYFKKNNAERGAARNFGVNEAKGEYINFFDSDDLLYPNHLSTAYLLINEKNNPEVFHLSYDVKNASNEIIQYNSTSTNININDEIIRGNLLSCNGVFIRKDIAINNLFNEDRKLSGTEDYLLWLKLSSRYIIYSSPIVTSTIINHAMRSVLNFNEYDLINRTNLLIKYLESDEKFMKVYGDKLKKIESQMLSYISIHAVLANKNKIALKYFFKAVYLDPFQIFTKRTLVIFKRLFLKIKCHK